MSVIVVATVLPLEEHRADVVSAIEQAIAQVHAEDEGCELYALHEGDDRLVLIEKWASPEALAAHGRGAALKTLAAALDGKLISKSDVQLLRALPAGSAQQGAL
jgi:quinol monooxygenase YgiN